MQCYMSGTPCPGRRVDRHGLCPEALALGRQTRVRTDKSQDRQESGQTRFRTDKSQDRQESGQTRVRTDLAIELGWAVI